jgi:hypothetical protein
MDDKKIRDHLVLFLKTALITTVIVYALQGGSDNQRMAWYRAGLSGLACGLLWVGNGWMSDWLSRHFSWTEGPARRLLVSLAATLLYTFLVWWLIATLWLTPYRGFDLMRPLQHFEWADFLPTLLITLFISTLMHGRGFLEAWKNAAAEAERLKKEHAEARFEALKNQVNPHFLFNSLNVLTALVHRDADQSEAFIRSMATVYRYVLDSRERDLVPLEEELQQLEAYVFMMKIRFGDAFSITMDLPDTRGQMAPLSLQMLLENVFKHNEVSKNKPLEVHLRRDGDYLEMSNPVQVRSHLEPVSGVGLENIRSRYQALGARPVAWALAEGRFTVRIPIVSSDE